MKKFFLLTLTAFMTLSCMSGCGAKKEDSSSSEKGEISGMKYNETSEVTNLVKIEMEDGGIIIIELYPDDAPITVANFKKLVSEKYYDGLIFHRCIKGFMIQGGQGKETPSIKGEFEQNGVKNDIKHDRGVISMARTNEFNSASSQFFICHTAEGCRHLNGAYAAFGKVIAGMETVDKIASVETDMYDRPLNEQKMKTVRFVKIAEDTTGTETSGK